MRIPLALYRNPSGSPIDLRIGERPGEPPFVYAAGPGKTVEGPANYERAFVSAGYVLEKQLGDGELTAPQAWPTEAVAAASPVQPAPAPPAPPEPTEPAGGVLIGGGSAPPVEEAPAPKPPPPKKRGG